MPLELHIAWRYMRSRRGSRFLSFISVIAIGGVVVGVSALIVVMGVMNGLQRDLREKLFIGSPDIRVLGAGPGMRMDDWEAVLQTVRSQQRVVAAAPFVMTQALVNAGHDYMDGGVVVGLPDGRDANEITQIRSHIAAGDFRFTSSGGTDDGMRTGAAGTAERCIARAHDVAAMRAAARGQGSCRGEERDVGHFRNIRRVSA